MNLNGCANCLMHKWKQVEDQNTLKTCSVCTVGNNARLSTGRKSTRSSADISRIQSRLRSGDTVKRTALICIQAAQVGRANIDNPDYECILKENFPPSLYHSHPFPISGCPEDTSEKGIIVLWQLLKKFELTRPRAIRNCKKELLDVFIELKKKRLSIWRSRKISQFGLQFTIYNRNDSIESVDRKVESIAKKLESDFMTDPFELWKVIELVISMLLEVTISERLQTLINPLADMPPDLHTIVSQGMSNSVKFMAKANQVLEALATQVISYQDVLKIICGGSLDKRCSFCSKKIRIANTPVHAEGSVIVLFECLFMEIYCYESYNCQVKAHSMLKDSIEFMSALTVTERERASTRCDFCFKLPPSKGGHRCSRCLTVMYCSTSCRDQDWSIHKDFCKEDSEERKKKFGSSDRKKEARENLEKFEKQMEESDIADSEDTIDFKQRRCEVTRKFKLKGASKMTDK